jgi:hypothetical protein
MNTQTKIISIDIGLKTTSFACEYYDLNTTSTCPKQKYDKNGEATSEFSQFCMDIATCGEVIHLDKIDLGTKKEYFAGVCFHRLYQWLETKRDFFKDVDIVLIEQQMKVNPVAQVLSHHVHAWILIQIGCKVVQYPSKNKTRILGMPLKIMNKAGQLVKATKYQRKRWSIKMTETILTQRNDTEWSKFIFQENKSKKDDLCDTIMQGLSYIISSCQK